MIEERAQVTSVSGEFAWIETFRKSACQSCSANKGCGTGALNDYFGKRMDKIKVLNPIGAKAGDKVIVGLQEDALLWGSLAIYLVPLVAMIMGAVIGQTGAANLGFAASDGVAVVSGLIGLGLGFVWVKFFSKKVSTDNRYQPIILRLDRESEKCVVSVTETV